MSDKGGGGEGGARVLNFPKCVFLAKVDKQIPKCTKGGGGTDLELSPKKSIFLGVTLIWNNFCC